MQMLLRRAGFCLCLCLPAVVVAQNSARIPLAIRGPATVYLRAEPGPLEIEIEKRDLNIYAGPDVLDVSLLAPDRTVVATLTLPDDGSDGKTGISAEIQADRLSVAVPQAGIYRLRIAPGNGDQVCGFRPSCPKYVIEGRIFLNDASLSGDVYFLRPAEAFTVTADAVHEPGVQRIPLFDGERLVHTFDLKTHNEPVSFEIEADENPTRKPWHLHIERQDVRIEIKGVAFWSPVPDSFFPVGKTKWLLTPYAAGLYLSPGQSDRLVFQLRNGDREPAELQVNTRGGGQVECRIESPAVPVRLAPGETKDVVVTVRAAAAAVAGEQANCTVMASYVADPADAASSAIRVTIGKSPVRRMLEMPIVLRPYEHENVQFGYNPKYPCNAVFFDLQNRPYIRQRAGNQDRTTGVFVLRGAQWDEKPFLPAIRERYPDFSQTRQAAGWLGTKAVFDAGNCLYTLVKIRTEGGYRDLLLYSKASEDSFQVHELPRQRGVTDVEQWTGHNPSAGPPPVLLYSWTADHPARFCSFHDLKVLFPEKTDDGLVLGEPVLVSDNCFGSCQHSGGPAAAVTRGDRTHIVWGEVDDSGVPGVPTYVATYDRGTKTLSPKVFLAHAPPVNDVHNAPGICADSEGYLHVVTGAHGSPFKYVRSLKPNDSQSGWTKPEDVCRSGYVDDKAGPGGRGRQTYLSLVCDREDALHIAFRQWRRNTDPYLEGRIYAALSYQRKPKDKPWEQARPLVVPPFPSYSIYYHKMTIDRTGRLFLSYSYYSIDEAYRNDIPELYDYRAVIFSPDGGDSWKLLETSDFEHKAR